jgi:hypothetical protein
MIDGDHIAKAAVHDAVGAFEIFEGRTRAEFEVLAERLSPGRSDPRGVEATKERWRLP